MAQDPDKAARDALLQQLQDATNKWYDVEAKRINDEVAFVRSVLKGRGGASALATSNLQKSKLLVINDIATFLAGQ